jgi:hypothetical protein
MISTLILMELTERVERVALVQDQDPHEESLHWPPFRDRVHLGIWIWTPISTTSIPAPADDLDPGPGSARLLRERDAPGDCRRLLSDRKKPLRSVNLANSPNVLS